MRRKRKRINDICKIRHFLFQLFDKLRRIFGFAHLEQIQILYHKQQRAVLKEADGKPVASLCGQFQQLLPVTMYFMKSTVDRTSSLITEHQHDLSYPDIHAPCHTCNKDIAFFDPKTDPFHHLFHRDY